MRNLGYGFVIYHSVGNVCCQIDDKKCSVEEAVNDSSFQFNWCIGPTRLSSSPDDEDNAGYFIEPLTEEFDSDIGDNEDEHDYALRIPSDESMRIYIIEIEDF